MTARVRVRMMTKTMGETMQEMTTSESQGRGSLGALGPEREAQTQARSETEVQTQTETGLAKRNGTTAKEEKK